MSDSNVRLTCIFLSVIGAGLLASCQTPFDADRADIELQRSIEQSIARELQSVPNAGDRIIPTQPPGEAEAALSDRLDELDAIGPYPRSDRSRYNLGADLTGSAQDEVAVSLQQSVLAAVERNLEIQTSRLQPAINEADVVAAQAMFDALLFGNVDLTKTDQPQTVPVIGGVPLGTPFNQSERYRFETGVRKRNTSGGEVSLSTDLTRSRNLAPGISLSPDPAYASAVRLGYTQPLLRGFGTDVNTATIRVAQNAQRRSIQQLRADLLTLVSDVEAAYWDLVFAWENLAIRQWLVDEGRGVRDVLDARRDFDTTPAEFADSVARVEGRQADVIRARRALRQASDRLKQLMNDPQLTVGSEVLLRPSNDMTAAPISYSLRDAILTALQFRPEIQQAILNIDDASIRQLVADNARLPLLNFSAQLAYFGLDDDDVDSYENLSDGEFIDYIAGLSFELPIGNREAEAGFRQARLRRSAAVINYRNAIQSVVLDVKNALRDVVTNYELITATRSFRIAQAENLRALQAEEETLAGLTPEFLNLKFQRQETLAEARRQELLALVNYDQSIAALYRALGIGLAMNRIDVEVVGEPNADD